MDVQSKYEEQNELQTVSEDDPYTLERYRQFHKNMHRSAVRILDVGCNTGRGGEKLKSLNPKYELHGLDCVKARLSRLPSCYATHVYGLSTDIPVQDGFYDAIVAGEFLEHLYPHDVDKTLCEFQRVLRIGGRVLLTTPNPFYLKNRMQRKSVYGVSHLTQHFPKVLKTRMQMHGFSSVKMLGSGKVTQVLGSRFPINSVYGSFLLRADKW